MHQILLALRPGWQALRHVWRPFLLCQLMAVVVVLAFFHWPPFTLFCARLGDWKEAGGLWFAAAGSAVAGVLLPELARQLSGDRVPVSFGVLVFRMLFFGWNGIMVATFYRWQGVWFGDSSEWHVVLIKMLCDQFGFTTFLAVPLAAVVFTWQAGRFRWAPLREELTNGFIFRKVLPVLLPNWAFWFPMVACIYSLPPDLQYVFFLFVFAAWSLLLVRLLTR